jgi:hypothetical protein
MHLFGDALEILKLFRMIRRVSSFKILLRFCDFHRYHSRSDSGERANLRGLVNTLLWLGNCLCQAAPCRQIWVLTITDGRGEDNCVGSLGGLLLELFTVGIK